MVPYYKMFVLMLFFLFSQIFWNGSLSTSSAVSDGRFHPANAERMDTAVEMNLTEGNGESPFYRNFTLYENGSFIQIDRTSPIEAVEYIYDRTEIRVIFIALYTLVFCFCFFGK